MSLVVHVAPDADPGLAAWCRELPQHCAAADPRRDLHRARNRLLRLAAPGGAVVVKAFGRSLGGLVGDRWRGSKARRSFAIAEALGQRGIPTPRPLAWCERHRAGLVTGAWYVCAAIEPGTPLHHWLREPAVRDWRRPLIAIGRALAGHHQAGVVHADGSPGNFICSGDPGRPRDWMLVDLNRVAFTTVPDARSGAAHLARLAGQEPERSAALLAAYATGWRAKTTEVTAAWQAARAHWLRGRRLHQRSRAWRRRLARSLRA